MTSVDTKPLYRLILVDDEDEVRGRISSKISQQSGFEVVGTAGNGHDALELIEKLTPHVVITDIRMPYIDGIELAGIIRSEHPTIRVAFITGYDEFDYAKKAIDLGVHSYLTKPLTQGDISTFLEKLKKELDDEFRQNTDLEMIQHRYEQSLPLIIDNYFSSLLSNAGSDTDLEIRSLANHGIELIDKNFILALIDVESDPGPGDVFSREKKKIQIRNVAKDILVRREIDFHHFLYHDGVVFLISGSGGGFLRSLDTVLLEAVQTALMYHSITINIGVSTQFKGHHGLRNAYIEARRALVESRFLHQGRIAYINQLEKPDSRSTAMDDNDRNRLEYVIRFGTDTELTQAVHSLSERLPISTESLSGYRLYLLSLVNLVVSFASATGADIVEANGGDVLETVSTFTTPEKMFAWFLSIATRLREIALQNKITNSSLLLDNAIAYIKTNYTDPFLNLESTCEAIGISVSYLSLLFKKNLGKTFVKYLTELRLDRARELLKYSGDRIIEIAEKCGYNDVYYFSHSFKKSIGISPKKYRENQIPS